MATEHSDGGDAATSWAPTVGATVGALVVLANAPLAIAGDNHRAVAAIVLALALLLPLAGGGRSPGREHARRVRCGCSWVR